MLQLTSRGTYGILAVYYIAKDNSEEFVSIDEIAEKSRIPKPYLGKILQELCRGGILLSRRGSGGGFTLSRSPARISLREVLEVIEGKPSLVNCLPNHVQCLQSPVCPISPIWGEVQNFLMEIIASITFADILNPARKDQMLGLLGACQRSYRERVDHLKTEPVPLSFDA